MLKQSVGRTALKPNTALNEVRLIIEKTVLASYSSGPTGSNKNESDQEHEAQAASENAGFFKAGISATAHHLKEKAASAVGMNTGKPISENETMGPAGHMQGRDPNANPEDEYKSLKAKSTSKWDHAGQDKPPNQQYPDHGKNS